MCLFIYFILYFTKIRCCWSFFWLFIYLFVFFWDSSPPLVDFFTLFFSKKRAFSRQSSAVEKKNLSGTNKLLIFKFPEVSGQNFVTPILFVCFGIKIFTSTPILRFLKNWKLFENSDLKTSFPGKPSVKVFCPSKDHELKENG